MPGKSQLISHVTVARRNWCRCLPYLRAKLRSNLVYVSITSNGVLQRSIVPTKSRLPRAMPLEESAQKPDAEVDVRLRVFERFRVKTMSAGHDLHKSNFPRLSASSWNPAGVFNSRNCKSKMHRHAKALRGCCY